MSVATALPPPLRLRQGWPFTTPVPRPPPLRSDGTPWPRVSVILPSYQQAIFLEEALRSILAQGYPDLEVLVYDGGSHDDSGVILARYAAHLAHCERGPDRGQAHALNKGFARATGSIIAWLNSDDVYEPGALCAVAEALRPERGVRALFGDCRVIDAESRPQPAISRRRRPIAKADWVAWWADFPAMQPAIFLSAAILADVRRPDGTILDERLRYAFDYDLWLRLSARHLFHPLPRFLASFRRHRSSKTLAERPGFVPEMQALSAAHWAPHSSLRRAIQALSAHVNLDGLSPAYAAVEQAQDDPRGAAQTVLKAVRACPPALLYRPRPFLAAARAVGRGLLQHSNPPAPQLF